MRNNKLVKIKELKTYRFDVTKYVGINLKHQTYSIIKYNGVLAKHTIKSEIR